MDIKLLLAARNKFVIATFIGDEEMFEQAKQQHAIATGIKVKNDNSLCSRINRFSHERRRSGTGS
ncbi:host cell division inhibitory peptide Kil [Enterobacter cloacae]|uniref:host cell division inhibitory peptide Kil n=1 Tax=Enterobacter cloacae TaxID=550 RepID=UPI00294D147C|nr:host cell division inhibitory peptide Kil [Enterobacter sichuanensis]